MPGLVTIKLKGSGTIIRVVPAVAIARVNGGTATYVNSETKNEIETNSAPAAETAVGTQQNAGKKSRNAR